MKYGYFDNKNNEYVITKPNTPTPWVNYLGSPLYGAIISNNAGGYSFLESGAKGRILRYRFNSDDKPGRYIYIRDDDSKDYWSASWQPVAKSNGYESICRHGLGYTTFETNYADIDSTTTYYVPLKKSYEVWKHKVINNSEKIRNISLFGYAELTNHSDYEQDTINLQYSQFISRTYFESDKIIQKISENSDRKSTRFFGLKGLPVSSFSGDKESFIGNYNTYGNPKAVADGQCDGQLNYSLNSCGALHTKIKLLPGEEKEIVFILGEGGKEIADGVLSEYEGINGISKADQDLEELDKYWSKLMSGFKVTTPDEDFNSMINTWNAYQCFITFTWSRAASFIYCGQRNGFGYRDTVQDIQGITHLAPKLAKKQIVFMLTAQVDNGGGLPLVKYTHTPGEENTPEDLSYREETGHPSYRADDALWLFPTIKKYINETGDIEFLNAVLPYANKGKDTVYDHLKKAIEFSLERLGANGLPAGLHADWNDTLRLGNKGESTFVAMQLYLALKTITEFAETKKDSKYLKYIKPINIDFEKKIEDLTFEDDRYIRGITDENLKVGSKNNKEASFWLNPQSWAVISGVATKQRAQKILQNVYLNLNTPYGAKVMEPPFKNHAFPGALAIVYHEDTKENGSIFLQTQGWLILAEALAGNGDRAYKYYKESSPAHQNSIADIRKMEPYVYGQFTESTRSPFEGRSHVHWLTGTASTVMVGVVEGILGMRPDIHGLFISPSIPKKWQNLTIEKEFRGKTLKIQIVNDQRKENGYKEIYLNKKKIENNYIPEKDLLDNNEILYIM